MDEIIAILQVSILSCVKFFENNWFNIVIANFTNCSDDLGCD